MGINSLSQAPKSGFVRYTLDGTRRQMNLLTILISAGQTPTKQHIKVMHSDSNVSKKGLMDLALIIYTNLTDGIGSGFGQSHDLYATISN